MSELGMTREEREAFLAEPHVGVVAIAEEGRAPLTVPVWYAYEPGGEIRFVTGPNSRKALLLKKAPRASLCVQTETAPYKYVSVEGPASVGPVKDFERDVRGIAHRYLGRDMGEMYIAGTAEERKKSGEVLVTIRPQRWYTVDYNKKIY
jgi:PPOX class probable F420-dependent enzyme